MVEYSKAKKNAQNLLLLFVVIVLRMFSVDVCV